MKQRVSLTNIALLAIVVSCVLGVIWQFLPSTCSSIEGVFLLGSGLFIVVSPVLAVIAITIFVANLLSRRTQS